MFDFKHFYMLLKQRKFDHNVSSAARNVCFALNDNEVLFDRTVALTELDLVDFDFDLYIFAVLELSIC